jgi:hypothetical protein
MLANKDQQISQDYLSVKENFIFLLKAKDVSFMTSPLQIVSLATALIPF